MDPNLNYNLEQFASILKATFTGGTENVKKAEAILESYAREPRKLIDSIQAIIASDVIQRNFKEFANNFHRGRYKH